MKINFEFSEDSREKEFKKMIKAYYKMALAAIEAKFDEEDDDGRESLEEIRKVFSLESTATGLTLNLDLSILDDEDTEELNSSLMTNLSKNLF